jgi:chromosomal replication initiation ATPase DnaA
MSALTIEEFIELSNLSDTGVTKNDITGRSRNEEITIAREVYWYCLNLQGLGNRRISRIDGRRKQTISSGIRTIKNLLETNNGMLEQYKGVIEYFHATQV